MHQSVRKRHLVSNVLHVFGRVRLRTRSSSQSAESTLAPASEFAAPSSHPAASHQGGRGLHHSLVTARVREQSIPPWMDSGRQFEHDHSSRMQFHDNRKRNLQLQYEHVLDGNVRRRRQSALLVRSRPAISALVSSGTASVSTPVSTAVSAPISATHSVQRGRNPCQRSSVYTKQVLLGREDEFGKCGYSGSSDHLRCDHVRRPILPQRTRQHAFVHKSIRKRHVGSDILCIFRRFRLRRDLTTCATQPAFSSNSALAPSVHTASKPSSANPSTSVAASPSSTSVGDWRRRAEDVGGCKGILRAVWWITRNHSHRRRECRGDGRDEGGGSVHVCVDRAQRQCNRR